MNTPPDSSEKSMVKDEVLAITSLYTPDHVKRKVGMVIFGLFVFAYGWSELWPPLSLVLAGDHALGEATRVIRTKAGLPDQIFTEDLALNAAEKKQDRSYVFWNEFHFVTADHKDYIIIFNIGSRLKPLFPLLDDDGLPTTVNVYYDPKEPRRICIPIVFSTWFAPGFITFMGAACICFGCLILYWARHKMEIN
jgi:hypothetical protein